MEIIFYIILLCVILLDIAIFIVQRRKILEKKTEEYLELEKEFQETNQSKLSLERKVKDLEKENTRLANSNSSYKWANTKVVNKCNRLVDDIIEYNKTINSLSKEIKICKINEDNARWELLNKEKQSEEQIILINKVLNVAQYALEKNYKSKDVQVIAKNKALKEIMDDCHNLIHKK